MMNRDRAWRRRKAYFEKVRDHEMKEVLRPHGQGIPHNHLEVKHHQPGKLTPAQDLRLNLHLSDELRDETARDAVAATPEALP